MRTAIRRNGVEYIVKVERGHLYIAPPVMVGDAVGFVDAGEVDVRLPENKIKKIATKKLRNTQFDAMTAKAEATSRTGW